MDVIHVYTRKQAIADGVLIDVTQMANEAGIRYPTAVTAAVWAEYVKVPDGVTGQDESGRLWDILTLLVLQIRCSSGGGSELQFQLKVRNNN